MRICERIFRRDDPGGCGKDPHLEQREMWGTVRVFYPTLTANIGR